MTQTKTASAPLQWCDMVDDDLPEDFYSYNISFGSGESYEEPTNLLEKERSQVSAAAGTPHAEDAQLVQDHPQASVVRRVNWKFPVSQTEDGSETLQHSYQQKNDKINYLHHQMDLLKTKLVKKNFFLTREKERRVAAENSCSMTEETLKNVESCLTCEHHLRQKCEQELKKANEVMAELRESLKQSVPETEYQSALKEVQSLKEQLQEKTASNLDLASKLTSQEEERKTQEKKVADLMKALFLSVINEQEETREVDIIPDLHLAVMSLPPKNGTVEELASQAEVFNLVNKTEPQGIPDQPKEKTSKKRRRKNKKTPETMEKKNQPEVIREPQDTEDVPSSIDVQEPEKTSEPGEEKETETASGDTQELIPLDLAQQTGPDMVPELMSQIEMELVQQSNDVSELPKGEVSSKKRRRKNKKTGETIVKNNQPEVIREPQDTEEIPPSIDVQEPEKTSEPGEEKETETASEDTQELIPLDLAQQTGPDMVPELMSQIKMELVQQSNDVSELPKGEVSSKKPKNKIQERVIIVIEMEAASKHPEDSQTSARLQATEDTAAPQQAEFNPSEERPEVPSTWRKFKKYMTPKNRRQNKDRKIKRERNSSV